MKRGFASPKIIVEKQKSQCLLHEITLKEPSATLEFCETTTRRYPECRDTDLISAMVESVTGTPGRSSIVTEPPFSMFNLPAWTAALQMDESVV